MNNQKPEPRFHSDGSTLDVHSVFFTIQGEGPFAGHRSVFVRLAGCNLQCPGCDTEYTEGRYEMNTRHLAMHVTQAAIDNNARGCLVVITGGEPFRQNIGKLVTYLKDAGHFVQIETNGFFAPDDLTMHLAQTNQLVIVCSPKTARIHPGIEAVSHHFKYVLDHRSVADDGLPLTALNHPVGKAGKVARPPNGATIYVNPMDEKDERLNELNLEAVTRSCKEHGYIMGVQMHKLANIA